MFPVLNLNDATACAAAALGLRGAVADVLLTEFALLGGKSSSGFDAELLARQAIAGTIFDQRFCEYVATALADADRRIAEGSIKDFEIHPGWDEDGREVSHVVPVTLLSTEAERLARAVAPARTMLSLARRTQDLIAAERAIDGLR